MKLEIKNLSFAYGDRIVLRDVSCSVEAGELLCILGPNGAGKSTFFRCILALLRNYSGGIFLDGVEIRSMGGAGLAKHIAYIPQAHQAVFEYTALEVVLMGASGARGIFSSPRALDESIALEQLNILGISHLAHRSYTRISGGERQLVLVARAMAQHASVLVMDEPTANLDYGNQVRVMERISTLSKEGYSVILSTHNPEQAFLWAHRAAILTGGNFIASGAPADVLTEELLARVYGVSVQLFPICNAPAGYRACVPMPASKDGSV